MDMVIDDVTGLPEVPEGLFWRIREVPRWQDKYIGEDWARLDHGELYVELCTNSTMPKTTFKEEPVPRTWRTLWMGKPEMVKVKQTDMVPFVEVLVSGAMMEYEPFHVDEKDRRLKEGWIFSKKQPAYRTPEEEDLFNFVRLMEPTAENALKVATTVLEKYWKGLEERRQREALVKARQKLMGIYPPKKLEN